ncbi:CYTH domain-containing protein [Marinobacter sediminum]|uniref:CYTH domain-containing protein n=1 Tax=Marinobacter sediminum TaxID=256323 RepID=UPI0019392926|nr:CYTH domain-containing protein [Marinobacter sediminum]
MAEELEIKLTLTDEALERALAWLLSQPEASLGPVKTLVNIYYDTPDAALNRQRAALRVRQAGDRYIQTLKTQGDFVRGAHRRQEWEWPLHSTDLNLVMLADTPLADSINLDDLQPVFETNFERQVVMVRDGNTSIEVAIDRGQIVSGTRLLPLNELELELKAGDSAALLAWAKKLAEQVPVFLNLVSKAEQGYYLAGLHEPDFPGQPGNEVLSVNEFLHGLSQSWLIGQPCPISHWNLTEVRAKAAKAGVSESLQAVETALERGERIPDLVSEPMLGRLQLAIASG